jgi:hypothetical protein
MTFSSINVLSNTGYQSLSAAEAFLFSSLQGLANQTDQGLYCVCNNFNGLDFSSLAAELWLGQITIPQTVTDDAWSLLSSYPNITSYILCDIVNHSNSANIASSLAGILGALTVDISLESKVKALGYTLAQDVTTWTFDHLLVTNGTSFTKTFAVELNNVFSGASPTGIAWGPRDFAIANKAIVLFGQAQRDSVMNLIPGCIPIYGWDVPTGGNEGVTITDVSGHGDYYVAADVAFNVSIFNQLDVTPNPVPSPNPMPTRSAQNANTKYVAFMMSDGDNLQWLLNRGNCPYWWGSPYRGQIPIGWTMAPALFYQAPSVWNYYVSTMSAQDEFICGASGIGYVFQNIATSKKFDHFIDLTVGFMNSANLNSVTTFGNDTQQSTAYPDAAYLQPYLNQPTVAGAFYSSFSPWVVPYNQQPYVFNNKAVIPTIIDITNGIQQTIDAINSGTQDPPVYLVYVNAWCNNNQPMDYVNGVVQGLPTDGSVQVVKPSELFAHAVTG